MFACVCLSVPSDPFSAPSQEWKNRDFSKDTWLEAVNPLVPSEVCVAKVTQVKGRLMWLRLEGKRECVCLSVCLCVSVCVIFIKWGGWVLLSITFFFCIKDQIIHRN